MATDRDDLEKRLEALKSKVAEKTRPQEIRDTGQKGAAGIGLAFRLGSEFVAGVLVGALLGWAFDRFLGTTPWGLIVFLLLGFGAGMLNMVRAANAANAERTDDEPGGR